MFRASCMVITSAQNPKVKAVKKLWDRKDREKTSQFIIEGYREILRANQKAFPIETLFICPELFLGSNEEGLINSCAQQGSLIYRCTESIFRSLSYRDRPDGLLGIAFQQHNTLEDLPLSPNPFFVVAESIEKPGNLGTILRSADAAGVDGLIVCDRCTDLYNPNVVRSSVGTLFTVKTAEAASIDTISWLKKQGISVVAATPSATHEYTQVDLSKPVAIAVGTEQLGLSPLWMENADIRVKIPMLGSADSLNVAMATTLLLYEVVRQRRG